MNYTRYWIGDLLYVLGEGTHWNKIAKFLETHTDGGEMKLSDGRSIQVYPLSNIKLDNVYDQVGNVYDVESGTIGCIKESDIKYGRKHMTYEELSTVGIFHELPDPIEHGIGFQNQIEFGPVHIHETKPQTFH